MKKYLSKLSVVGLLFVVSLLAFTDKTSQPPLTNVEKMRVVEAADLLGIAETTADIIVVVDRPTTIASGTCPMPANPIDGQTFTLSTRSAITSLTLNANGRPISGTITTLAAGGAAGWCYDLTSNRWFRLP